MSDFVAKKHRILFRLGLRPRPHYLDLRGPTSMGREGKGREENRREG